MLGYGLILACDRGSAAMTSALSHACRPGKLGPQAAAELLRLDGRMVCFVFVLFVFFLRGRIASAQ